ncbi:hypothetical protein V493_00030 [Pseudogymnoascus sp. VKM F-4281 (FW-2241)]|nr:hypothetical protein V493_00030 [Pseudogymnoascus sp. VKM F-4281 (FW-2241)]
MGKKSIRQNFLLTRHFIGRHGSHIKTASILTAAGWRMPELFVSLTIKTRPSLDHLTTLSEIIKRMLPAVSEETPRIRRLSSLWTPSSTSRIALRPSFKQAASDLDWLSTSSSRCEWPVGWWPSIRAASTSQRCQAQ